MNYPIWELTNIGGGTMIALISIIHAYVAHLAVGGGIFIWLTDLKGYRENSKDVHNYVYKHTNFFLLLTMVFGGITGVGIWFIIALVHPAGTSSLIHNFVFGWAIEWVFFLGEITALLIYYYQFHKLERKPRLILAFFYALFAWLSLFIINGILSFMLTPGKWIDTMSFWHGFLNPTFLPSLFFRSFYAAMIAGLFGYVTAVFIKDTSFRNKMIDYCSKWLWIPLPGLGLSGLWYYFAVPESIRQVSFGLNPQSGPFIIVFALSTILIYVLAQIYSFKSYNWVQKTLAFVLVIIGLTWYGGFEYLREISRKPWVIGNYMYSTSIKASDTDKLNKEGLLTHAKWTTVKEINDSNRMQAGKELFNIQCLPCHTVDGIRNPLSPKTESFSRLGIMSALTGQGKIQTYMPQFVGTKQEMAALSDYIYSGINGNPLQDTSKPMNINKTSTDVPSFDRQKDEYMLLVWNDLGMHCISDNDPWFVILPPANTLEAQLIKRGELPQLVTEGVELRYKVEPGFKDPASQVKFWDYAEKNFGVTPERNIGLHGNGLAGVFKYNEERSGYIVETIPVVPYKADGSFNPYPTFTVQAVDIETDKVLIETKVVAPTSTEMGCRNCHGGDWRTENGAGIADETSINILKAHDRLNGTTLFKDAENGNPKLCQSCHADPALGAKGKPEHMNLSAAMHGWHANYMPAEGAEACALCHPAAPNGFTRCSRGFHAEFGLDCVNCHGTLSDHAAGLLQAQADKPSQKRVIASIVPNQVKSVADVNPRMPWLQEPDCLTCHIDFEQPDMDALAFNHWNDDFSELYRIRTDNAGVRCEACHGSTHAVYPAVNPYQPERDVLQPMQYSGNPYPIGSNMDCAVCHTSQMQDPLHHENMLRMFRNSDLVSIK